MGRLRRVPSEVGVWLVLAAAGAGLWSAMAHGTDFLDMLLGGQRLLAGTHLYDGSGPAYGMVGPPFQAVILAPFAWIAGVNLVAARVLWALVMAVAGVVGVVAWRRALGDAWAFNLAGAAIAFPLYREIQVQNMTLLLFATSGLAALALSRARDAEAGAWIGLSTAAKLFPGFLLLYVLVRGRRTAAWVAAAVAAVLSLTPMLRFGPSGFVAECQAWLDTRLMPGFPVWTHNQSLATALSPWLPPAAVTVVLVVVAALVLGVGLRRWRRGAPWSPAELPLALAAAVVLSPIAWVSYWVLVWPAVAVALAMKERAGPWVALVAGLFITGLGAWRRDAPGYESLMAALLLMALLAWSLGGADRRGL